MNDRELHREQNQYYSVLQSARSSPETSKCMVSVKQNETAKSRLISARKDLVRFVISTQ
jgi:hypothetical protein